MFKLSLALLLCLSFAAGASAADLSTHTLFDPAAFEAPESVQFDRHGNAYVSLALTGEIRKIAPDGTQTTLAFLPVRPDVRPCGNAFGLPIMGSVALDHQGNVYASVNSCEPSQLGVWKVTPGGAASLVAHLPQGAAPNGIAYHDGWLYVSDTLLGRVWRVHPGGAGAAEVWTADPLLTPLFIPLVPGPNGLQVFRGEVYVAVSDRAHVAAFPINDDGSAGPGRVHASGVGLDDFAFDVHGNLYGTTDPFNTLVRVSPGGAVEVLLTAADGLDGPTSAAFGVGRDSKSLYITNAAFPFFPGPTPRRPSLMRLDVGVPGQPRP
ncbi:MAG TPA: hypothetical protein VF659_09710 [Pyrinomonadaceae bacterium]|jgi:sugar lactone lactonase YvrE